MEVYSPRFRDENKRGPVIPLWALLFNEIKCSAKSQVMNKPVIVLQAQEKVGRILEVLESMPHVHSGFPVVDEYDPVLTVSI